jgi:hypothetical protein
MIALRDPLPAIRSPMSALRDPLPAIRSPMSAYFVSVES